MIGGAPAVYNNRITITRVAMAVPPGICQATSVCNREMGIPGGALSRIAGRRFLFATTEGAEASLQPIEWKTDPNRRDTHSNGFVTIREF
jgi:hypothetical protein